MIVPSFRRHYTTAVKDAIGRTETVTREQVAARFPDLAEQLGDHDTLCRWRQNPWLC
jgi:hypothetical protein